MVTEKAKTLEKKKALHDYLSASGSGCSYHFSREEIIALERKTGKTLYTQQDLFDAIHALVGGNFYV